MSRLGVKMTHAQLSPEALAKWPSDDLVYKRTYVKTFWADEIWSRLPDPAAEGGYTWKCTQISETCEAQANAWIEKEQVYVVDVGPLHTSRIIDEENLRTFRTSIAMTFIPPQAGQLAKRQEPQLIAEITASQDAALHGEAPERFTFRPLGSRG